MFYIETIQTPIIKALFESLKDKESNFAKNKEEIKVIFVPIINPIFNRIHLLKFIIISNLH